MRRDSNSSGDVAEPTAISAPTGEQLAAAPLGPGEVSRNKLPDATRVRVASPRSTGHQGAPFSPGTSVTPSNSVERSGRMLTRQEAAQMLGISQATLSRWAAGGVGPAFVKYDDARSGAVRYPMAALESFIQSRMKPPKP